MTRVLALFQGPCSRNARSVVFVSTENLRVDAHHHGIAVLMAQFWLDKVCIDQRHF